MHTAILRSGILLALVLGTSAVTAQTELSFATGVDSTGWAQAQSNADGHVLIESPQYPRGLWLHLVNEAGDALAGIQVEYQGRADSLVAIRCVDMAGKVRETLVWTRPEGNSLHLMLKPKESDDLPAGLAAIDWRIDPTAEALLELEEETRLEGWEAVVVFLRERWQDQAGRVAVQLDTSTLAVGVDHPENMETLVAHLKQVHQPAGTSFEEKPVLYAQVFRGDFASLQGGVILYLSLFADANLERVVRERLGRPQGRLTPADVASLKSPYFYNKDIHSLAGIEYLTALQRLDLGSNHISDLTPLNQLTNLESLNLYGNQVVDLTPLNQLTNLQELAMGDNQKIADLTPLKQLTNLQELDMGGNQVVDLTPLKQLTNLQKLWLEDNQIVDPTPLTPLTNLKTLSLGSNHISDLTPLNQLTNLKRLYLRWNQIVELSPLNQLTNLEFLSLYGNQVVDLTPLNQLTNLQELWLEDNQIEDLAPLIANAGLGKGDLVNLQNNPLSAQARNEQIPALKERGVSVTY